MAGLSFDPPCYDIPGFCEAHHITRSHFYELLNRGEGPRVMKAGRRTLISGEAAAEWRRQMEEKGARHGAS